MGNLVVDILKAVAGVIVLPLSAGGCGAAQKALSEGEPTPEEAFHRESEADPRNAPHLRDGYVLASVCKSVSDHSVAREWSSMAARDALVQKICTPTTTVQNGVKRRFVSAEMSFSQVIDQRCDSSGGVFTCCATAAVKPENVLCGE